MLYHDYRTGHSITDLLVFPDEHDAPYERSYSPEYFAAHSEHITLATERTVWTVYVYDLHGNIAGNGAASTLDSAEARAMVSAGFEPFERLPADYTIEAEEVVQS
jgi:hypothetical protein